MHQLPAHDFDDSYCDDLSDKEKEKMQAFNRKRNEEASGQGSIKENNEAAGKVWVGAIYASLYRVSQKIVRRLIKY